MYSRIVLSSSVKGAGSPVVWLPATSLALYMCTLATNILLASRICEVRSDDTVRHFVMRLWTYQLLVIDKANQKGMYVRVIRSDVCSYTVQAYPATGRLWRALSSFLSKKNLQNKSNEIFFKRKVMLFSFTEKYFFCRRKSLSLQRKPHSLKKRIKGKYLRFSSIE